jgi:hypothetical protein
VLRCLRDFDLGFKLQVNDPGNATYDFMQLVRGIPQDSQVTAEDFHRDLCANARHDVVKSV